MSFPILDELKKGVISLRNPSHRPPHVASRIRVFSRIGISSVASAVFAVVAALIAGLILAPASVAAPRAIVVWVDKEYKEAAKALFADGYKKRDVKVRVRDMSTVVEQLQGIDPKKAPDIVLIENDQTSSLVNAALVTPLELTAATQRALSSVAVNGFKYNQEQWGVPMQRQNLALVTNVGLIRNAPKTFARLSTLALKRVAAGRADVAFALPQGLDGDAYSTYPLFSGLGGYVFKTNDFGSYNANKVGINNKKFVKNQGLIDQWNKSGLINSALTADEARSAFVSGRAPFWLTGPEDIATLKTVNFQYRISQVPTIVKGITPAPMMKSIGFAVTTFASEHKLAPAAKDLVANVITTSTAQETFYNKSPYVGLAANSAAAGKSPDKVLLAFASAALGAVAYPNVPDWPLASISIASAWRDSTRGGDSVAAAKAFSTARAEVKAAQLAAQQAAANPDQPTP